MGKYYESSSTFPFSWDQLACAYWKRYPNPESSHVLSEDTLKRELCGGILFSRRIMTKTNRVPKWGERFVKTPVVAIVEESRVDPKSKKLTTYTRNIGMSRIMSVTEKVIYTPDPDHPGQTVAKRMAWIDSQVYGFRRPLEAFGLERFKNNATRAASGFTHVLSILYPQYNAMTITPSTMPVPQLASVPTFDETKEKLMEGAKKAGKLAREKISIVSSSTNPTS